MHELESALGEVRNAWLAGRGALDAAPASWRETMGGDELALIAIAGHAIDVMTAPAPVAALNVRPLLPRLSPPTIPDVQRPRFRRLLSVQKTTPSIEHWLIAFAAVRGYVAHPGDWMPAANDDWAPPPYAPWLDWLRAETTTLTDDVLTIETYDQWSWSERRRALDVLRAADPGAARAIIAAKAQSEPAERRLRLIETLRIALSEADADFLETLVKDRSDRVQALARALLARLGRGAGGGELAAELAAMLELKTVGLLKRRKQMLIKALKTPAQAGRRRELFGLVPFTDLAAALGADDLQLVDSAPDAPPSETADFAACAAATGSDAVVRALLGHMLAQGDKPAELSRPLIERLGPDDRRAFLPRILARDGDLRTTLEVADDALGTLTLDAVRAAPGFAALQASLASFAGGDDDGRAAAAKTLDIELARIGLLVDAAGARILLADFVAAGLSPAEPRLDMLHLNIALAPEAVP